MVLKLSKFRPILWTEFHEIFCDTDSKIIFNQIHFLVFLRVTTEEHRCLPFIRSFIISEFLLQMFKNISGTKNNSWVIWEKSSFIVTFFKQESLSSPVRISQEIPYGYTLVCKFYCGCDFSSLYSYCHIIFEQILTI